MRCAQRLTAKHLSVVGAAVVMTTVAGCGGGATAAPPAGNAVTIKNFAFGPQTARVTTGTTLTWTNTDPSAHWVKSSNGDFSSGSMPTNAQYSFTFKKAGTYSYFCNIHNYMTGTVVVSG